MNIEIETKIKNYMNLAKNKGLSENTIKNNVLSLKVFLASGLNLKQYKEMLIKTPIKISKGNEIFRKSSSINTTINALKGILKLLNEDIEEVTNIKIQKQNFLENVMNEKDLQRIIMTCDKFNGNLGLRSKTLFLTLARSGCRISEALSIEKHQVKDLKKKGGLITIIGKGSKERQVIITKEVKSFLDYYIANDIYRDKSSKVFTTLQGSLTRQTAHNQLKKFAGLARVKKDKCHLHNFRHLFCLNAIKSGIKIEDLAQIVGHTDINTTKVYTAKSSTELQKILENI